MTITEAQAIAAEYDEALKAMRDAMRRFDEARRDYQALPLFFEKD